MDAAPSAGTSQPVTKSKEYHNTTPQILKRVVAITHKHTHPSIHEEGRVELSLLEDMYYEQQRIRVITRRIRVLKSMV
jgi:hypothetical protein